MRLFIATWPPATIIETLASIERDPDLRARWTRPDQWHITLRFVGKIKPGELDALTAAIDCAAAGARPAEAVLGPRTECFGRHILHVPVAGLDDLAAAVIAETAEFGASLKDEPFAGHLTLARTRRSRGGRPRGADLRRLAGAPVGGRWPVREICLVRSQPDPGGIRYEVIHEVVLDAE